MNSNVQLSFLERSQLCTNPTAKKLFSILHAKNSRLALAADTTSAAELIYFAELLGDQISVLKTHIDILSDFTPAVTAKLKELSEKHQFILFEDRKFADIGNTVQQQYQAGIYKIANWSPITNAHILPGPGIIEGLRNVGLPMGNGLLLLAEMSSKGSLAGGEYTQKAVEWAEQYSDFVIGFICQHKLTHRPEFIHMTPGVHLSAEGDPLGQHYLSPYTAIHEKGSDIIIVGRGITAHSDPKKAALSYLEAISSH